MRTSSRLGFLITTAGAVMMLGAVALGPGSASAIKATHKVTICHATHAETNPYVKITVDYSAVNGIGRSDHMHHTGPIWYPGAKAAGVDWGDIIPYVDGVTVGLNWNDAGRAIRAAGCTVPTPTTLPPTTAAPTTAAPTTEAPTTEAPTTAGPTTAAPTTEVPTTDAPTTSVASEPPTTPAPTTTDVGSEGPTTTEVGSEGPTTTEVGSLPSTGASGNGLMAFGAAMVGAGLVMTALSRRPRHS